jgi:hypothetical protein
MPCHSLQRHRLCPLLLPVPISPTPSRPSPHSYAPAPSKPQEEMLARSLADYRSQAARLAKEVEAVSTQLHADQRQHTEVANYLSAEVQALTERTRAMQVRISTALFCITMPPDAASIGFAKFIHSVSRRNFFRIPQQSSLWILVPMPCRRRSTDSRARLTRVSSV